MSTVAAETVRRLPEQVPTHERTRAVLLALLLVGVPLVIVAAHGGLGLPHNDDWSYLLTAQKFASEGRIELFGWNAPGLLGQVVVTALPAKLLGGSVAAFNLTTAALALVGLLAVWGIAREHLAPRAALLVVAVTGSFPAFGLLATSYMTDVPAFALIAVALLGGTRYLLTGRVSWVVLALVAGGFAVATREQAIAAPAALLLLLAGRSVARGKLQATLTWCVVGVGFLAVVAAYVLYRRSLPNQDDLFVPRFDISDALFASLRLSVVLSLALLPVAACMMREVTGRSLAAVQLAALTVVAFVAPEGAGLLPGNYLAREGAYRAAAVGAAPGVLTHQVMQLVVLGAGLSGTVLLARLLRGRGRGRGRTVRTRRTLRAWAGDLGPRDLLVWFSSFTLAIMLFQFTLNWPLFDRYALPLVAPLSILALRGLPQRASLLPALPALLCLAALQHQMTASAASFDVARWNAASTVVATTGVEPRDVLVGLEWSGTFAGEPADTERLRYAPPPGQIGGFTRMWTQVRECYAVLGSPVEAEGFALVRTHEYRLLPFSDVHQLYVYDRDVC